MYEHERDRGTLESTQIGGQIKVKNAHRPETTKYQKKQIDY